MPQHVAIIMDGNGRWAAQRGLERAAGHREGVEAVRRAVRAAGDLGVKHLTLYSFSTENWRRPKTEIRELMGLMREYVDGDIPKLREEGVRIRIIGDRDNLDLAQRQIVQRAERDTAECDRHFLNIAFNYGGRDEIVRAAQRLASAAARKEIDPAKIDERMFSGMLDTAGAPDPDLVIRTSGERRISNFLLWQAAYAEFVFLDVLWPDFSVEHFAAAISEYQRRERRYGGVGCEPAR